MAERLTKTGARNVFYGGSIFFFAIFVGLTAHSHYYMKTTSTDESTLTSGVARGKHVWEKTPASIATRFWVRGPILRPSSAMSGSAGAAIPTLKVPVKR
ncbi:hypothetical protein AX23_10585 [Brucella melitensis 548]|nr:hypothetical protein AX23_10585 [Brucella melitensis 548]